MRRHISHFYYYYETKRSCQLGAKLVHLPNLFFFFFGNLGADRRNRFPAAGIVKLSLKREPPPRRRQFLFFFTRLGGTRIFFFQFLMFRWERRIDFVSFYDNNNVVL